MKTTTHTRRWLSAGIAIFVTGVASAVLLCRQPAIAQDEPPARIFLSHPQGIARGQTLRNIFFLPAVQRAGEVPCRLIAMDINGNTLASTDFLLAPGRSFTGDVTVAADGSVRFNGRLLRGLHVRRGDPLETVPCIRILNLPRTATLIASAQCVDSTKHGEGGPPEPDRLGKTATILPYIEITLPEQAPR
jgi:hypothetical protein